MQLLKFISSFFKNDLERFQDLINSNTYFISKIKSYDCFKIGKVLFKIYPPTITTYDIKLSSYIILDDKNIKISDYACIRHNEKTDYLKVLASQDLYDYVVNNFDQIEMVSEDEFNNYHFN